MTLDIGIDIERPRPATQPCEGKGRIRFGEMNHHRRNPGHADLIAVDDAERQNRRNAGIYCVAAGFQDLERGQRCLLVTGAYAVAITA